jgi:hypothetical protein
MSEKYTLDTILEMFNGIDNGFSYEQIYFVYHSLNGNEEKAEYFKSLCLEESNKLNKAVQQMKSENDIKEVNLNNNLNINNNAQ